MQEIISVSSLIVELPKDDPDRKGSETGDGESEADWPMKDRYDFLLACLEEQENSHNRPLAQAIVNRVLDKIIRALPRAVGLAEENKPVDLGMYFSRKIEK